MTKEKEAYFEVFINPLAFLEVDKPWAGVSDAQPTTEDILRFICMPGDNISIDRLVARYREISIEEKRLFAVPNIESILQRMIWPLRHAKASYMLGNFLGTISLCGMVAEMATMLIFEISEITINGNSLDEKKQKQMFGRTFERLGQEQRVNVLIAYNLINDKTKEHFDNIRAVRRRYLHLYSQEHANISEDAISVFNSAVNVTVTILGLNVDQGKILLSPNLIKHMKKHGLLLTKPKQQKDDKGEE